MFPPLFLSTRCATLDLHNYAHKFARAQMYGRQISKCCTAHIANIHKCTPKQTESHPARYLSTNVTARH